MNRPRPAAALALALSVPIGGCVKAPPRSAAPDVAVPVAWDAAPGSPAEPGVHEAWWLDFDDAGLADAIRSALADNRDLRVAAARVDRARAEARIAGADLRPSASVSVDAARRRQNFIGLPIPSAGGGDVLSSTATTLSLGASVSWEPDLWGRLRAGARAALADLQGVESDFAAARLSLAAGVAKTWIAVAEAGRQRDLARATASSWRDSYERVDARYASGLRSPLDVRQARTAVFNAEALVRLREQQFDAARRALAVLLGRYPGDLPPPPGDLPGLPEAIPAGLPSDLIARRPDLAAAERRLAAADQRWVAARRSLYPRLSLTATGGTASSDLADLLDGDFRVWSVVAGLAQPLFQGGRLRAGVDRADAARVEGIEAYAAVALRAYGEVETALAAEGWLADRASELDGAVREARRALELADQRYEQGLEDYVTVLDTRRTLLAAETALLEARGARLANRVDLYLALGGGFVRPDLDSPPSGDDVVASTTGAEPSLAEPAP